MPTGETLDLEITDIAHGGVFVARHEGRVVFVPDALPGERVRVRVTDDSKASYWRAETLEVLDASPHRRPHVWDAADIANPPEQRPGGADFGHIRLEHQRVLKQRVLEDALQRFGGLSAPTVPVAPAFDAATELSETPDGTGWRTRVSLHVDDAGRVGPYAARSHRVIPVADLPLAVPDIARAAQNLHASGAGGIDLVQPSDGRVRVITRAASRGSRRGGRAAAGVPDASAREVVVERVGGREFRVDAGGFWQVHRLAAAALTRTVEDLLHGTVDPEAQHLDLYGGVGLFAATLAGLAGAGARVTTVESDPRATEHAGENLAHWLGARAETARVDRYVAGLTADASPALRDRLRRGVVLLDPPRTGAGRAVVEHIAALQPASVVYVACDPVALARDLGTFRAGGYEPVRLAALDLFPNSHHLETVALLSR